MGWLDRLRRSSPADTPAVGPAGAEPSPARSSGGAAPAWSQVAPLTPTTGLLRPAVEPQRFADTLVTRQPITFGAELGHHIGDPRALTTSLLSATGSAAEAPDEIVAARPLPPAFVRPAVQTWPVRPDAAEAAASGPEGASPDLPAVPVPPAAAALDATSGRSAAHPVTATPSATGRPSGRSPRLGPPRDGSALQRLPVIDPGGATRSDEAGPSPSLSAGPSVGTGPGEAQDAASGNPAVSVQTARSTGPLSSTAASDRMGWSVGAEAASAQPDSAAPTPTAPHGAATSGRLGSLPDRGSAAAARPETGSASGPALAAGPTGGAGDDDTAAADGVDRAIGSSDGGWAVRGRIEPPPAGPPADRPLWTDSGAEPWPPTVDPRRSSADVRLQRDAAGAVPSAVDRATSFEAPGDRPHPAGPSARSSDSSIELGTGVPATAAGAAQPVPTGPVGLLGARPIQTQLADAVGWPHRQPSHDASSMSAGAGRDSIAGRDDHDGYDSAARHDDGAEYGGVGGWPDPGTGGGATASVQRSPVPSSAGDGSGPAATADPGAAALAAGVAERDGDGVRFRWADPYPEEVPIVQRATGQPPTAARTPAAPADPAAGAGASAPPAGGAGPAMTPGGLDELARQLYDRIRDRLGDELRRDRERAGLATGLH
ncbi:hypothetical protein F4553_001297 [Allocatelliglobosispora scoriae]|uniref:Uncharacterized protein n=1 Tax=Allocatelliglobosispora scoriae TaxID=643052 RepID=A0A841BKN0_9ACTN|nr:hypothetical protein [Allocatelliglobosispora scoriae]MBB5867918.1 hypothetical protein [Allocatelliglobosispora scoriae]